MSSRKANPHNDAVYMSPNAVRVVNTPSRLMGLDMSPSMDAHSGVEASHSSAAGSSTDFSATDGRRVGLHLLDMMSCGFGEAVCWFKGFAPGQQYGMKYCRVCCLFDSGNGPDSITTATYMSKYIELLASSKRVDFKLI